MGRRGIRAVAAAVAVVGLTVGCSPMAGPTWRQVPLPPGVSPSSLAAAGADLLVGGIDTTAPAPYLVRLADGGDPVGIALEPDQGYARVADLVWLNLDGSRVRALGVARGGAHGNQRWTAWEGPLTGPVRDQQQDFTTFGGHEAGPLLGIVTVEGEPLVVGSRAGDFGFDAVLWTHSGTTWTRQPVPDPVLASSPDRVLSFRAAASTGTELLIAGAEVGLAGGVHQAPQLWAGAPRGRWRSIPLAAPDELAGRNGLAQATSVACTPASVTCWVAGWVRGRPVAWEVDVAAGTSRPWLLDGEGGSPTDPVAVVGLVGGRPVVFTNADPPAAAWRCAGQWRTTPAPAGRVSAAAALSDRMYAVAGDEGSRTLWEAEFDTREC